MKSARLYATALGAYELFLDGKRVGDDVLAPGWTDYREHVKYQTYDVTALTRARQECDRLHCWRRAGMQTPLEWFQQPNNYGDTPPALKAQLRIEYTDGSVEWVATDTSWKASALLSFFTPRSTTARARICAMDWPLWDAGDSNESALEDRNRH